jgi:hypothetical protein
VVATSLTSPADGEAGEEEGRTPTTRDETPSKKAKTPKTPAWKETQKKAAMKKVKAEVEESEAEADADAEAEVVEDANKQARETPGVQAQVDEQIKTEMQDFDGQFDDADMFRMD